MTIDAFLKYLQYEKNYSTHTVFAYKRDVKQFIAFVEADACLFSPENIDGSDLRRWIVDLMDKGNTATTVNRKISSVKTFYKYLQMHQVVRVNPVTGIAGPKKPKPLPHFVKADEMDLLFDRVGFKDDFTGTRDRLIMDMLYSTGMRLSELQHLKLKDVDLGAGVVKVTGKRNKQRIIPLNKSLVCNLQSYLEKRKEILSNQKESLFVTLQGNEVYPKLIYRVVNKYLSMITTISKKSPHVLRHTFATVLLNKGADINVVKSLLGHANLSATEVYTHSTFDELTKIYKLAHPRA